MAVGSDSRAAVPVRRTQQHEAEDALEVTQNSQREAFKEWPNEAGFEGLTEHRGPVELKIQGNIPVWVTGSLFRTGPGISTVDAESGPIRLSHLFDGLAHTHRFDIIADEPTNGVTGEPVRVLYSSRRQSDALVKDMLSAGKLRTYSFAQKADPCIGLFGKAMSVFQRRPPLQNTAVTVQPNLPGLASRHSVATRGKSTIDGPVANGTHRPEQSSGHRTNNGVKTLFLATDTATLQEIDASTLEPIGYARQQILHPDLCGVMSSAHAQRDPHTGDYFNWNLDMGRHATYRIFQVSEATGKTTILATIKNPNVKAAYIHSFFLTPNYVVLCIPVSHYGCNGIKITWERNILDAIEPFDDSKSCQWFVVDRQGGRGVVAQFKSPASFFFHSINSFEEDGDVVCELIEYPNLDIMFSFYYDILLNRDDKATQFWGDAGRVKGTLPRLVRYRFPLDDVAKHDNKASELPVPEEILSIPGPHAGELPTLNPAYATQKHRYVYSLLARGLSTFFDAICKTDTETREVLLWSEPGHTPGEPIFVPRPSSEEKLDEDDGAILSVVLDGANRKSYLLCLDAKTMLELGRAECEFAVPFGFHGHHAGATS